MVFGLAKDDALFWAWGQAQMMIERGCRMIERKPKQDGGEVTNLDDENGAKDALNYS